MQKAVVLEKPGTRTAAGIDKLGNLVLARIAAAERGSVAIEVAADLAPLASSLPQAQWRTQIQREIEGLTVAGFASVRSGRIEATEAGKAQTARFLGIKGDVSRTWSELRDVRLVASVLGLQRESATRLKALATLDGLRGAIVEDAYKLKVKGVTTPARLREALAATALKRAFGDKSAVGVAGKLGLSAKAGRLLAAQLSLKPRNFGTDTRLIAALAAEHVGCDAPDVGALRSAILQKFFGAAQAKNLSAKRPPAKRALGKRQQAKVEWAPAPAVDKVPAVSVAPSPVPAPAAVAPTVGRPDLPGFASEVRRHAASQAHGWSGDRKAYISHVWRNIRDKHPNWGLSEIEFKCMLAEAHRSGQLALANADLKDKSNIKDVQDSALVYRNAVFHFIRVDA